MTPALKSVIKRVVALVDVGDADEYSHRPVAEVE